MGSLEERIRQLQEEERSTQARLEDQSQQRASVARDQERQVTLQRNEEQRRQQEEKLGYFSILDAEDVGGMLEEVKRRIWHGQGSVTGEATDTSRAIRLLFKQPTKISEIETKTWMESYMEYSQSQGGDYGYGPNSRVRSSTSVKQWHKVVRRSYLEMGVNVKPVSLNHRSFPATLYVMDTSARLYRPDIESFNALSQRAVGLGSEIGDMEISFIELEDGHGKPFNKSARSPKHRYYNVDYRYSLDSCYGTRKGVALGLTSDINRGLIKEFLEYNLALSSSLRQESGTLPGQLR